ncbi:DUF2382 domain-containing protein [Rhodococcus sp. X156]|uniref:DUF2382 domain-containing protein n=1 Tax=Rhodococcus sp. X156 TaxID=2499145 RepID=UPI000FDC7AAD|nr:DUF2382 domain-containing protein [Rhodococcus sp. X156]
MSATPDPGRAADPSAARPGRTGAVGAAPASTTRAEEELDVRVRRVPVERVRVRRRVVTETRQVSVDVRREELVLEHLPVAQTPDDQVPDAQTPDQAAEGAAFGEEREPVVLVLHEEVPVVQLATRPYERVTVRVERVDGAHTISADLAREVVEVHTATEPPDQR